MRDNDGGKKRKNMGETEREVEREKGEKQNRKKWREKRREQERGIWRRGTRLSRGAYPGWAAQAGGRRRLRRQRTAADTLARLAAQRL